MAAWCPSVMDLSVLAGRGHSQLCSLASLPFGLCQNRFGARPAGHHMDQDFPGRLPHRRRCLHGIPGM